MTALAFVFQRGNLSGGTLLFDPPTNVDRVRLRRHPHLFDKDRTARLPRRKGTESRPWAILPIAIRRDFRPAPMIKRRNRDWVSILFSNNTAAAFLSPAEIHSPK